MLYFLHSWVIYGDSLHLNEGLGRKTVLRIEGQTNREHIYVKLTKCSKSRVNMVISDETRHFMYFIAIIK